MISISLGIIAHLRLNARRLFAPLIVAHANITEEITTSLFIRFGSEHQHADFNVFIALTRPSKQIPLKPSFFFFFGGTWWTF